ncbi:excisionase family protein [Enterobacter asburiae]|uniref:excisionase family protein n=1 Tax=Enterobacter asburiae TaxID=61645 RepID=UPI002A815632|nr:excisionase family protein [Enterobacter asburiae]
MSQVIYDSEWGVASKLKEKTGLTDRQIKSYRQTSWVEGVNRHGFNRHLRVI